ncbi:SMP-30/gluconolactonase/LRE family protein [Zavarzinia sp. CC-PAN008]|uniref:SMP-30/gluconolactonase/LRE family protein n=1 Tax=Zavarzinia sp. CC-PAN008 TaxID=3243332 RepID=UPI003F74921D
MTAFREITSGLGFPEGPIAMPDGSVILVEIQKGNLTRVKADGTKEVIAHVGGGPNGAALGPGNKVYICNNGGFEWHDAGGILMPGHQPADYIGGRIQTVDLATGAVETLYDSCDGVPLKGPNDLVFDGYGGFWFTDHGKGRDREADVTGFFYAKADGSQITEIVPAMRGAPNGIGLSPDGARVYVAETWTGRVWFFDIESPGKLKPGAGLLGHPGQLLVGLGGLNLLDSLAVDSAGNVCVATLLNGGITVISPDGTSVEHIPFPDPLTTNICFGGPDLKTAFITLSGTGRLVAMDWPRPGLKLHHLNT